MLVSRRGHQCTCRKAPNGLFATSHSQGTKPPCWRAKVALGQGKQKTYIIWNGNFLCLSCLSATCALHYGSFVPREWLAAKGLLERGWEPTINSTQMWHYRLQNLNLGHLGGGASLPTVTNINFLSTISLHRKKRVMRIILKNSATLLILTNMFRQYIHHHQCDGYESLQLIKHACYNVHAVYIALHWKTMRYINLKLTKLTVITITLSMMDVP